MEFAATPLEEEARAHLHAALLEHYAEVRRLELFEQEIDSGLEALRDFLIDRDSRTFCILVVSFMEDALKRLFETHWTIEKPVEASDFFGGNGPLSTFSQRVLVALGTGWLRPDDYRDTNLLRKIRNEFAHNHEVHSLTQDPLRSFADALTPSDLIWKRHDMLTYKEAHEEADAETLLRIRVYCASTRVVSSLVARSKLQKSGLPPSFRAEGGWKGLTEIEQRSSDHTVKHTFRALGIRRSGSAGEVVA